VRGREPVLLRRAEFRFRLGEDADLSFLWGTHGLRVSRHGGSGVFTVADDGQVPARRPLPLSVGGGWHRLELDCDAGSVRIDGGQAAGVDCGAQPGRIGFRAGEGRMVDVDEVTWVDADGRRFHDDFRNRRDWPLTLLVGAMMTLIAGLLYCIVVRQFAALWIGFALWASLGLLYGAWDYTYWSRLELSLSQPARGPDARSGFERWRQRIAQSLNPVPNERDQLLTDGYPMDVVFAGPYRCDAHGCAVLKGPPPVAPRIVLLGTSQTVGAGAPYLDATIAGHLARRLGVEVIDLAVSGSDAPEQLEVLRRSGLHPDLLVANFSFNDTPQSLAAGIDGILASGARTVLVEEAANPERPLDPVLEKHALLRERGARAGVPVLALHQHMLGAGDHFLWWDGVHLTAYGQALAGDWLAEQLRPLLIAK
jgi:hypothetical protein